MLTRKREPVSGTYISFVECESSVSRWACRRFNKQQMIINIISREHRTASSSWPLSSRFSLVASHFDESLESIFSSPSPSSDLSLIISHICLSSDTSTSVVSPFAFGTSFSKCLNSESVPAIKLSLNRSPPYIFSWAPPCS